MLLINYISSNTNPNDKNNNQTFIFPSEEIAHIFCDRFNSISKYRLDISLDVYETMSIDPCLANDFMKIVESVYEIVIDGNQVLSYKLGTRQQRGKCVDVIFHVEKDKFINFLDCLMNFLRIAVENGYGLQVLGD